MDKLNLTENQKYLLYLIKVNNVYNILHGIIALKAAVFLLSKDKEGNGIFSYDDFEISIRNSVDSTKLKKDIEILVNKKLLKYIHEPGPFMRTRSLKNIDYRFNDEIFNIFNKYTINKILIEFFLFNLKIHLLYHKSKYKLPYEKYAAIMDLLHGKAESKFNDEISYLFDHNSQICKMAYIDNPNLNKCLFYVTWIPMDDLTFNRICDDINAYNICQFKQTILFEYSDKKCYESRVFKNHHTSIKKFNESIRYAIKINQKDSDDKNQNNIAVELYKNGIVIFGIKNVAINNLIKFQLKNQSFQHLFSIMSESQLDLFAFSGNRGIKNILHPPGKFLEGNSNINLNTISLDLIDGIITELFYLLWTIWNYDLRNINKELIEKINRHNLSSINAINSHIGKDIVDINLIMKYVEKFIASMEFSDNDKYDDIKNKFENIQMLFHSTSDYHNKTSELISTYSTSLNNIYENRKITLIATIGAVISGVTLFSYKDGSILPIINTYLPTNYKYFNLYVDSFFNFLFIISILMFILICFYSIYLIFNWFVSTFLNKYNIK